MEILQERAYFQIRTVWKRLKGKRLKILLCVIEHHNTKTHGRVEVWINTFLTSPLDLGEWWVSRPCRFNPGKDHSVTTGQEVSWAPEPEGMLYLIPAGNRTSIPWSFCEYSSHNKDEVIPAQLNWLSIKIEFVWQTFLFVVLHCLSQSSIYTYTSIFVGKFAALVFVLSQVVALHGNWLM
jgi:hypothetical protein